MARFLSKGNLNLAYKINGGICYNAEPGASISMKNSFLIGTNKKKVNHNGIFSIQTIFTGQFAQNNYLYSPSNFIFTNALCGEYNCSINLPKGFNFVIGLYIQYSIHLDISQYFFSLTDYEKLKYYFYYNGIQGYKKIITNFNAGIKFLWAKRFKMKKRDKNIHERLKKPLKPRIK